MVIFSYLLLGHAAPAAASLESVLAPVWVGADGRTPSIPDEETSGSSVRSGRGELLVEPSVDGLDVLAELERQLAEKLQPAGRLRLVPVSHLPEPPRGTVLPEVVIVDHPPRIGSSLMFVRFRFLSDGQVISNHAVTFRAQVTADVWYPARRLAVGERIAPEDFSVREVDLAREPKAVPADRVAIGSYELARAVAPERPLVWSDLAPRSLVRKGDLVDVVGSQGLLSISMKGQATRSGALGDSITIRNLDSKREFPAEVVDENKVRVHF